MSDNDIISDIELSSKMGKRIEIFRLVAAEYTAQQAADVYNKKHPDEKAVTADWIRQTKYNHKDEYLEVKSTENERMSQDINTIGHKGIRYLLNAMDNLTVQGETNMRDCNEGLKFMTALWKLKKEMDADIPQDRLLDEDTQKEIDSTIKSLLKEKDGGYQ